MFVNKQIEIGWFPVTWTDGVPSGREEVLPKNRTVSQWHSNTFDLPAYEVHLYSSVVCRHQAFLDKDGVIALQFHLETTIESAIPLMQNCQLELVPGPSIHTEREIIEGREKCARSNATMARIREYMTSC